MEIDIQNDEDDLIMDLYFPNIIKGLNADAITGVEIMNKIKALDGEGSGLDADTLDGKHATDFCAKSNFPHGCVVVGDVNGNVANGGNYNEFVVEFNKKLSAV